MVWARRPSRGKRSAAAVSSDLASAARSSSENTAKISLGSRLAPSMRSLWTMSSVSGRPLKSTRMAAPRAAGCGRAASAQVFDGFGGLGQIFFQRARGRRAAASFSNSRRPGALEM